jgi:hypothetical protein
VKPIDDAVKITIISQAPERPCSPCAHAQRHGRGKSTAGADSQTGPRHSLPTRAPRSTAARRDEHRPRRWRGRRRRRGLLLRGGARGKADPAGLVHAMGPQPPPLRRFRRGPRIRGAYGSVPLLPLWHPIRLGPSFEIHVRGGGRIRVYTHIQFEMPVVIWRVGDSWMGGFCCEDEISYPWSSGCVMRPVDTSREL